MTAKTGHLVIIGGAEDRTDAKDVLQRVIDLSGGQKAQMVVLTTASRLADEDNTVADEFRETYEAAFRDCGAEEVTTLHIHDRQSAGAPEHVAVIENATGVFMTGGDQERLVGILGGTPVGRAMHEAFEQRGACIAGTSAGASAFSEHMMAGGPSDLMPKKGQVPLAPGLGFLYNVVIDQHFSQRQRLPRLLAVIAQNPFLLGVGIDEDTALVVTPDKDLEVVGSGGVTVLDGRQMTYTNVHQVQEGDVFALSNILLHVLPAGFRYNLRTGLPDRKTVPETFHELIATVVAAQWRPRP